MKPFEILMSGLCLVFAIVMGGVALYKSEPGYADLSVILQDEFRMEQFALHQKFVVIRSEPVHIIVQNQSTGHYDHAIAFTRPVIGDEVKLYKLRISRPFHGGRVEGLTYTKDSNFLLALPVK